MAKCTYTPTCHVFVDEPGGGHVYPDTKENREMGRKTTVELSEGEARRYGDVLKKTTAKTVDGDKPGEAGGEKDATVTHNKQVTDTRTK